MVAMQLEFEAEETNSDVEAVLDIARDAIDLDRHPGFSDFTAGTVAVEHVDHERIVLATDNRWAASAIRTELLQAGCAIEGDAANEATAVTVWAISASDSTTKPETHLREEFDKYGRSIFILDGPNGAVEQRCGCGGHNDLVVHARRPFPGATRETCQWHGEGCWRRSNWPWEVRSVRSLIQNTPSETGSAWRITPEAEAGMRDIYLNQIHKARPGCSAPASKVVAPAARRPNAIPLAPRHPARVPVPVVPRMVDIIRDLADFEGAI